MAADYSKVLLEESEIPTQWYNVIPDLPPPPPPPLHPGTHEPIGTDDLAPLFPMALIMQEVSQDSYIDIPGGVLDVYKLWRPSPLFRARRLEQLPDTPAKIFYKYEGVSPAGSHKPNTSVPQAYYNHQEGITKLTTETGAGQRGRALAFATVHPSPSDLTEFGRSLLAQDPDHNGSLGIAISEAVSMAIEDPNTR